MCRPSIQLYKHIPASDFFKEEIGGGDFFMAVPNNGRVSVLASETKQSGQNE
jgi:hypothetical protein